MYFLGSNLYFFCSTNENGLLQRCIKAIKKDVPDFLVITDIAMDPYSTQGHDGYVCILYSFSFVE